MTRKLRTMIVRDRIKNELYEEEENPCHSQRNIIGTKATGLASIRNHMNFKKIAHLCQK